MHNSSSRHSTSECSPSKRSRRLLLAAVALIAAPSVFAAGMFNGNTTNGNLSAWRINQGTGELSLCSSGGEKTAPACYPASAKSPQGSYDILDGDDLMSRWRINRTTGAMSLCEYKDTEKPPVCSPWSE